MNTINNNVKQTSFFEGGLGRGTQQHPPSECVFAPFLKWLENVTVLTEFKSTLLCHLVKNTVEILEFYLKRP